MKRSAEAGCRPLYKKDPDSGCWSLNDNAPSGEYSDGTEVEARLLRIVRSANDLSSLSPELAEQGREWVTRYHLSRVRRDLLRPLSGLLSGRVLEVGAGCGALSRFIGETAATLVALEPSAARAAVAAARCRDLQNVSVIVDNLQRYEENE